MPLCNGADIGCVSHIDNITGRESDCRGKIVLGCMGRAIQKVTLIFPPNSGNTRSGNAHTHVTTNITSQSGASAVYAPCPYRDQADEKNGRTGNTEIVRCLRLCPEASIERRKPDAVTSGRGIPQGGRDEGNQRNGKKHARYESRIQRGRSWRPSEGTRLLASVLRQRNDTRQF